MTQEEEVVIEDNDEDIPEGETYDDEGIVVNIQNVVASVDLYFKIPLEKVASKLKNPKHQL